MHFQNRAPLHRGIPTAKWQHWQLTPALGGLSLARLANPAAKLSGKWLRELGFDTGIGVTVLIPDSVPVQ
ncbi:type I toxin-antitoxin system SymE family toxin [Symbiopectobacterium purcellii]|uniref:Type I toxin-antitoxin system SymE family toxin n=1 Tax=Symbiopectobacterium purcellii TaxID=2871826 RepID=A0ABX9ARS6_9ENTR|nr:type I toxin-antitoxin system SymE family toxin [Symbiopectobacterium purcellii]QZN97398.1 type I toxin-antitoxin system SymE family toxin [Symbiopectobacterium purcellii]